MDTTWKSILAVLALISILLIAGCARGGRVQSPPTTQANTPDAVINDIIQDSDNDLNQIEAENDALANSAEEEDAILDDFDMAVKNEQ